MRYFEIKTADGRHYIQRTEDIVTIEDMKNTISSEKWIKLPMTNSKDFENVQTCNIVSIIENKEWDRCIKEHEKSRQESLAIIKQIAEYKFNWRMKLWEWWQDLWITGNPNEHKLLKWNIGHLENMLRKCEKYKCKKY